MPPKDVLCSYVVGKIVNGIHSLTVFFVGDYFCGVKSGQWSTPMELDLSRTSRVYLPVN